MTDASAATPSSRTASSPSVSGGVSSPAIGSPLPAGDEQQRDEWTTRYEVEQIIDSYTLCMVGAGSQEYVAACADDVLAVVLGWPVRYETPVASLTSSGDATGMNVDPAGGETATTPVIAETPAGSTRTFGHLTSTYCAEAAERDYWPTDETARLAGRYSDGHVHIVKAVYPYFDDVVRGVKNFDVRCDDRDYQVGDLLILAEWDGEQFTGQDVVRQIIYVLRDGERFGVKPGFVVLGLAALEAGRG